MRIRIRLGYETLCARVPKPLNDDSSCPLAPDDDGRAERRPEALLDGWDERCSSGEVEGCDVG